MKDLKQLVGERNIIIKGGDALTKGGFTQVPNAILRSSKLTPGAKMTYAMLLSYAWQNDYCFPGQTRLGSDIGVTDRSVRTYLKELESKGLLRIKQQGLNKPNVYHLDMKAKLLNENV